jgi:hypothetical protein
MPPSALFIIWRDTPSTEVWCDVEWTTRVNALAQAGGVELRLLGLVHKLRYSNLMHKPCRAVNTAPEFTTPLEHQLGFSWAAHVPV